MVRDKTHEPYVVSLLCQDMRAPITPSFVLCYLQYLFSYYNIYFGVHDSFKPYSIPFNLLTDQPPTNLKNYSSSVLHFKSVSELPPFSLYVYQLLHLVGHISGRNPRFKLTTVS